MSSGYGIGGASTTTTHLAALTHGFAVGMKLGQHYPDWLAAAAPLIGATVANQPSRGQDTKVL